MCTPFVLPSPSGPHRALSRVPCALREVLIVICLHVVSILCWYPSQSPNSSHPPTFPLSSYICSLCLCLYFCLANKIIYTIFRNAYGQTHQIIYIRYAQIFNINYTSVKVFKKKRNCFLTELKSWFSKSTVLSLTNAGFWRERERDCRSCLAPLRLLLSFSPHNGADSDGCHSLRPGLRFLWESPLTIPLDSSLECPISLPNCGWTNQPKIPTWANASAWCPARLSTVAKIKCQLLNLIEW